MHWCFQAHFPGRAYFPFPGAESFVPTKCDGGYSLKSKTSRNAGLRGTILKEWPLARIQLDENCFLERHFFELQVNSQDQRKNNVYVYCVRTCGAPLVDGRGLAEIHLSVNMDDFRRAFGIEI